MIRFNNDYNRTAHPHVLEVLQEASSQSYSGYGTDEWCARAEACIRTLTGQPEAAVWFFRGRRRRISSSARRHYRRWRA